jgi:hypothetical protein
LELIVKVENVPIGYVVLKGVGWERVVGMGYLVKVDIVILIMGFAVMARMVRNVGRGMIVKVECVLIISAVMRVAEGIALMVQAAPGVISDQIVKVGNVLIGFAVIRQVL